MTQAILIRILDDLKILEPQELKLVEQAIRDRLPRQSSMPTPSLLTPQQIEAANALLRETIVTLPTATGTDNKSIDADLAREYGEEHAALYQTDGEK